MRRARIVAHGELLDHLDTGASPVVAEFELPAGLRDVVQSTGIPHVEVGRAIVDGSRADWSLRIGDEAGIELWPRYPLQGPCADPHFLLDVHLGKLARHLRLLGIDPAHEPDAADEALAQRAPVERRTLLSRDRGLLMRRSVTDGRWIRATDPLDQAVEVMDAFALRGVVAAFTQCLECNGPLEPADPTSVDVPATIRRDHDRFTRCRECERVYWAGTHHQRLAATVQRILDRSG